MKATDIIELDNGEKYVLVSETEYNGEKYFLAQGLDANGELNKNDYQVFKGVTEDGEEYVDLIEDKKLIDQLSTGFSKELSE